MTTSVIFLLLALGWALLFTVACEAPEPAGPTVNVSGDQNHINVPSGGTGNTQTTPAPVIVQPVVIEASEPEA